MLIDSEKDSLLNSDFFRWSSFIVNKIPEAIWRILSDFDVLFMMIIMSRRLSSLLISSQIYSENTSKNKIVGFKYHESIENERTYFILKA